MFLAGSLVVLKCSLALGVEYVDKINQTRSRCLGDNESSILENIAARNPVPNKYFNHCNLENSIVRPDNQSTHVPEFRSKTQWFLVLKRADAQPRPFPDSSETQDCNIQRSQRCHSPPRLAQRHKSLPIHYNVALDILVVMIGATSDTQGIHWRPPACILLSMWLLSAQEVIRATRYL